MDEEVEQLVVSVRADTQGFASDVASMRGELEGPLASGAERAGRAIESTLLRAAQTGKPGFEDLRKVALWAMADIASAALKQGITSILQSVLNSAGGGSSGGSPGRATGGPVSPGRPYIVGERGPELFVPTASGRVVADGGSGGREVRVSIAVNAAADAAPQALARSSRQVARAVTRALSQAEG